MQHARSSWAQSVGVERGHDDGEPDFMPEQDVIEEWDGISGYKMHNAAKAQEISAPYMTGFCSEAVGNHLFAKVWAAFRKYQHDKKLPEDLVTNPEYASDEWKMTFTLCEPVGELVIDEDDEEEDKDAEIPTVSADVSVTCKAVEIEEDNEIPKKVYLNFKRKDGS